MHEDRKQNTRTGRIFQHGFAAHIYVDFNGSSSRLT
jgi:hypothetical protein